MDTILSMRGIIKTFPGVVALSGVDFDLQCGEVHALLGINGAGKSTLVKILAGVYQKDAGKIYLNGQNVEIHDPLQAKNLGISTVYQDPQLIPSFTGYENIFLGSETRQRRIISLINRREMRNRALELLERFHFELDLDKPVNKLGKVEKEIIAILRALSQKNVSVLILDEPTSILTRSEIAILFEHINILKKNGISIIYITHRLEEVFEVADKFTILRNGKNVGTYSTKKTEIDTSQIAELMLGEKLKQIYPTREGLAKEETLRVENISLNQKLNNCTFSAYRGEILGIFGLVGSGFDELCKILFGILQPSNGKIFIKNTEVRLNHPKDAIQNRVFLIPGDRQAEGLVLEEAVSFNTTLANLKKISTPLGLIKSGQERKDTLQIINQLNIASLGPGQSVTYLSGGNQQKVVIGKGIYSDADIYIFEEPTAGVDVGTKASIYHLIRNLSKEKTVICVSSDVDEIFSLCDRIIVLYKGQIVLEKLTKDTNLGEVLLYGLTGGK